MPALAFHLAHPLPAAAAPDRVVRALHRYEPLITPNPFLVSFHRRPVDLAEIVDDPFFRDDGQALAAFEVVDRIVLVPGLATKQVVIPCVMQRFANGLRCRSFAAGGVRVWSTWRVIPAADVPPDAVTTSLARASAKAPPTPPATPPARLERGTGTAAAADNAYALVEDARVECSSLVKPFVGRSFQSAHLEILRSVVRGVLQES